MINVYKKVDKDRTNLYGCVEVRTLSELDKPFLLCLSAQNNYDRSIYGMMREGAQAARLYTTTEDAARYQLSDFPADFLGLRFTPDEKYSENYLELAERFLYPFLFMNGDDPEDVVQQARKINFLTFCDGTLTYKNAEIRLKELLLAKGYSKDIVLKILSQISLVAIGTIVDIDDIKATGVVFIDVNDEEISNGVSKEYQRVLMNNQTNAMFVPISNSNSILYTYNGTGRHSIKEYLSDDCIVKPAVCAIVSHHLENSIYNQLGDSYTPIDRENNIHILYQYTKDEKVSSLLKQLDQEIQYEGASKYSKKETELRRELDSTYKSLVRVKRSLSHVEDAKNKQEEKIKAMIEGIRTYCSDVAFYQVLVSAHMWQSPASEDYFSYESDREIRKKYETNNKPMEPDSDSSDDTFLFELNADAVEKKDSKKR